MDEKRKEFPVFLLLLMLVSQVVGCGATDDPPPPQRTPSEGVAAAVERAREDQQEEEDSYFDMDLIGGRYEVLGEDSADFGLGFESRLIMLWDSTLSSETSDRRFMGRLLVEVAPDLFQDYMMISEPLEAGSWPRLVDAEARIIGNLEPILGEWNGYFFVHDHNGNGVDEVVYLSRGGAVYLPRIREYQNGACQHFCVNPFRPLPGRRI